MSQSSQLVETNPSIPKHKSKSSFDCSSRKNQIERREKTASPASIESDAQREKFCFRGQRKLRRDVRNLKWNTLAARKRACASAPKSRGKELKQLFHFGSLDLSSIFSFIIERSERNLMGSNEKKNWQRMRKWVNRVDEVDKVAPVVVSWEI